jgi:hypothetical protein
MANEDPGKAWPPELIEFSIMTEVHRLAFIFRFIVTKRPSRQGYSERDVRAAADTIGSFEGVLDDARLPQELDETLRYVIRTFRANPGPLPPELEDRYYDRVVACLLRDLPAVPESVHEYRQRIAQLIARRWVGEAARVVPRGWLPIVERAVRVGETAIEAEAFEGVGTSFMGEKFGRLDWSFNGHRDRFAALLSYVRTATNVACMACTRPGEGDGGPGRRTLKLCGRHRELRHRDEPAFRDALYPGGPPDHPDVKLY